MRQSKKPSLLQSVVGMAVILTIIFVILFSGASAITDENIKGHLDRLATYMAKDMTGAAKTGKFSYGDVTINGFGFNKSAVVSNVSIEFSEKSPIDTSTWSASTEKMLVLPDPALSTRLYFVFPSPINIIENGQLKTTITASTPIKYSFTETGKDVGTVLTHALIMPNQIIFTPAKTAGDDAAHAASRTIISLGDNGRIIEQFTPGKNQREGQVAITNLKLDSDDGAETTIASISAKFAEEPGEGATVQGQYDWTITDISGPTKEEKDGKPYSLIGDVSYKGDSPMLDFKTAAPLFGNTEFTVNKWMLSNDDFKVLAQGKLLLAGDDPLPSGLIDVSIENAGQFVSSYLVPGPARSALGAALAKVTGQPVDAQTHADVTFKRDKNGVFYIGDMTFESLTAALAADALKLPPSVLPPSDTPAPIVPTGEGQPLPGLPTPDAAPVPPAAAPVVVAPEPAAPTAGVPVGQAPAAAPAAAAAAPVAVAPAPALVPAAPASGDKK